MAALAAEREDALLRNALLECITITLGWGCHPSPARTVAAEILDHFIASPVAPPSFAAANTLRVLQSPLFDMAWDWQAITPRILPRFVPNRAPPSGPRIGLGVLYAHRPGARLTPVSSNGMQRILSQWPTLGGKIAGLLF